MKVDVANSAYHEAPGAKDEFDRRELRHLRLLLRRLRFLETKTALEGGMDSADSGAVFAAWEMEAMEWLLKEVGFLPDGITETTP